MQREQNSCPRWAQILSSYLAKTSQMGYRESYNGTDGHQRGCITVNFKEDLSATHHLPSSLVHLLPSSLQRLSWAFPTLFRHGLATCPPPVGTEPCLPLQRNEESGRNIPSFLLPNQTAIYPHFLLSSPYKEKYLFLILPAFWHPNKLSFQSFHFSRSSLCSFSKVLCRKDLVHFFLSCTFFIRFIPRILIFFRVFFFFIFCVSA